MPTRARIGASTYGRYTLRVLAWIDLDYAPHKTIPVYGAMLPLDGPAGQPLD